MKKMNLDETQMRAMEDQAKSRPLTYDDMYLILNKQSVNQNVQQATQKICLIK